MDWRDIIVDSLLAFFFSGIFKLFWVWDLVILVLLLFYKHWGSGHRPTSRQVSLAFLFASCWMIFHVNYKHARALQFHM